jgi:uroporphyrinogen-III synthase
VGKYIYTYIENGQMYDKSPSLAELLAKEGLSCEKIVTGRIEYIKIKDFETQIKDAQWLVFTSKNAVAGFAYNAGNVVPAGVKVAVVGKNTQNALRTACGIEADYVSSKATGLALGEELMNAVSGRVVYLCAEVTSGSLEEAMNEYENLIKIPVYRNEPVDYDGMEYDSMNCGDIDGIIVTSGSSGERIKWLIDRLDDVLVYSIGPACSKKLMEAGIVKERIVEAEKHTYDGLVEAVRCRADEKPVNDESVRLDINEYLERPKEVLSMFSEALRILDRNTAELMVDRMKDEMDELKLQKGKLEAQNGELEARKGELEAQNEALKASFKEKDAAIEAKDAEIERLKKLLEEQNK